MQNKRPQDQTVDEWLDDYQAEEWRMEMGERIELWVDRIMTEGSKVVRQKILAASPESIRETIKSTIQRQWKNRNAKQG